MGELENAGSTGKDGVSILMVEGRPYNCKQIIEKLGPFISYERSEKISAIINERTYTISPVLDTIYDEGNINAIIRSAENLGYQSLHIINSPQTKASVSRVTQGSDKWVDIYRHKTRTQCITELKARGYRVVATSLRSLACTSDGRPLPPRVPIEEMNFSRPLAIVFGNEKDGVHQEILEAADLYTYIPTVGLAESFNVSVAASIVLYTAYSIRKRQFGRQGDLDSYQQEMLKARFYLKSVRHSGRIIRQMIS